MNASPARCLMLLLLLLGLCSLTLAVDETAPLPEDLDGSGDDEDFSGSGSDGLLVDLESKDVTVFTTSVSTLVPTVEGSTAAQEPEIVDQEETKTEDTTTSAATTTFPDDDIKDPIAVDTDDAEATTKEATTSPSQQEETDAKKHHHHHHHHHPHHHTTTSSTTLASESGGDEDGITDIPPAVDLPEQTTTHIPDTESGLHHIPQELTTPVGDLAKYGVLHEETTSGATSTYVDNEEAAVDPLDNLPALVTTTVSEDSHTHEGHHPHHHHHHHHHHHTTTTPSAGIDGEEEVTTKQTDLAEPESNAEEEKATTVAEDEHPHPGHHHQTTTMSTEPEKPYEVHTKDPKGRRILVPDGGSTTTVPVIISEDDHIPEDTENDDLASTTVQYNVSRSPFDENDEVSDSKEEGPSGVADEDIFFEVTNPILKEGRMNPSSEEGNPDDGSSDASHGIMERKELLAGIIAGGVAGLAFAAALVVFVLYRMKKKDEGSYSLEEPKQSNGGYQKPREQREFYA